MIAVTGATGQVGRRVVARLADVPHRLVVRDRTRAPAAYLADQTA